MKRILADILLCAVFAFAAVSQTSAVVEENERFQAEESKKAAADQKEDSVRSDEQKRRRDKIAADVAEKITQNMESLEKANIFSRIAGIEHKKQEILDIQAALDSGIFEIRKKCYAEFSGKMFSIMDSSVRSIEKDERGNPSAAVKDRRAHQIMNLRNETDSRVMREIEELKGPLFDRAVELYTEIKEDQKNLSQAKTIYSFEKDMKVQYGLFNQSTNSWPVTFWLYDSGVPVAKRSFVMTYKDLVGKDVDLTSDSAYNEFIDNVDLYNSLFSRGIPVITLKVAMTAESVDDYNSKYRFIFRNVVVSDTLTGANKATYPIDTPVFEYQAEKIRSLNCNLIEAYLASSKKSKKDSAEMALRVFEKKFTPMVKIGKKKMFVAKTEVTQKLYRDIVGRNPSHFVGDRLPVENISWYDAILFCNGLSERAGLEKAYTVSGTEVLWNMDANGYRLLTDEEWEYAALGGKETRYSGSDLVDDVAWYESNAGLKTHDVAGKKPNGFKLYDMSGNVWEWCWQPYDMGSSRMHLGGGMSSNAERCEADSKTYNNPDYRYKDLGFRICRTIVRKPSEKKQEVSEQKKSSIEPANKVSEQKKNSIRLESSIR